jgi:hypothetical protein
VPSLSKTAIRSAGGTKSAIPGVDTRSTKETIDCRVGPGFQDGNGSWQKALCVKSKQISQVVHSILVIASIHSSTIFFYLTNHRSAFASSQAEGLGYRKKLDRNTLIRPTWATTAVLWDSPCFFPAPFAARFLSGSLPKPVDSLTPCWTMVN